MHRLFSGWASGLSRGAARRRARRRQSRQAIGSVALIQTCESLEDRVLLAGVASGDILVTDIGLDALFIVDPTTGDREILSGDPSGANVGTGPSLMEPLDIIFVDRSRIYVADAARDAIFQIDGMTGNRQIVSIGSNDATTAGVSAVGTGIEFTLPVDIAVDTAGEFAYVTDLSLDAVIQVDLRPGATFGDRQIVSNNTTPNGTNPFSFPLGIAFDAADRLLVADANTGQLLRIDNTAPGLGARTVVSDFTTPDGTNPFANPADVAVESNGTVLVTDQGNQTLFRVHPTTGARTILSNATTPDAVNPFQNISSIAQELNGNIIVMDRTELVFRVDGTTGARTILSGGGNGTGPAFNAMDFGIAVVTDDHTNSHIGATPIAVPSTTNGEIEVAGDDDFFKVSLVAGTAYKFETILGTHTDTRLQLLDMDGTTQLAFSDDIAGGANRASRIVFSPNVSGDYFLNVDGFGSRTGTYMLDVSAIPPDDHGNIAATATPVAVPSTTNGEIEFNGDPDVFSVTLLAGTDYRFRTILGTLGDSALRLFDTDGTTELEFDRDDGPGSASVIGFTPTVTGTYFLQVTEDGNNNTGTYMLDVSEIVDDHGDDHTTATPVPVSSKTDGEIEVPLDDDFFQVSLTANVEYKFETVLGTLTDTTLRLLDTNGTNELDSNDDIDGAANRASRIVFTPTVTGDYFLQVEAFGNETGTYMLDVSSTPIIIDDGDAGFSTIGPWAPRTPASAFQGDTHHRPPNGLGESVATWEFTGLVPGTYHVAATWFAHANRASNSPFTVRETIGGAELDTAIVNQKIAPNDFNS
ncbi:MAG: pre-peptidase C-terminal domain-containing protein, partial [Planctomycetaceae bacterium]|nr:pre-peptidase C-terminal domain-containing protein [Planctomycetaceae bacterium]